MARSSSLSGIVAAEYAVVAILKVTSWRRNGCGSEFVQTYLPGRRKRKKASQMRLASAASRGQVVVHCWIKTITGFGISGFFGLGLSRLW